MKRLTAVLAMTIALAACATADGETSGSGSGSGGSSGSSGSSEPLPADQVVLSVDYGDFVDQTDLHADVTDLVVYGDGRVYRAHPSGPQRSATFELAQVDAMTVAGLVSKVEGTGLIDESTSYGHPEVMDGGSVLVTVHAHGEPKSTDVYALSDKIRVPSSTDQANRDNLIELIDEIEQLADGAAPAPVEAAQVVQSEAWNSSGATWPGPAPSEFIAPVDDKWISGCGVLTGEQAQAAVDAAAQNEQFYHWMVDGKATVLVVRPLLPGEEGCTDI